MYGPSVEFRLPGGTTCVAEPDAIVGRSPIAAVRVDDPRVSTVHAELSWREGGFVLIARGGRLRVGGRAVGEVRLAEGLPIELAPGVEVRVERVVAGRAAVVPATAGRDALRFVVGGWAVHVYRTGATDPTVGLTGVAARVLAVLLETPGVPVRWDQVAEAVWPDEGAIRARTRDGSGQGWTPIDERRLRNRWDQALRSLRTALDPLGRDGLLEVAGGTVAARLYPEDRVEIRPG